MNNAPKIEKLTASDAQPLALHYAMLGKKGRENRFFYPITEQAAKTRAEILDFENPAVYAVRKNGLCAAVCEMLWNAELAEAVLAVSVLPAYRKRGYAKLLMHYARQDFPRILAEYAASNPEQFQQFQQFQLLSDPHIKFRFECLASNLPAKALAISVWSQDSFAAAEPLNKTLVAQACFPCRFNAAQGARQGQIPEPAPSLLTRNTPCKA